MNGKLLNRLDTIIDESADEQLALDEMDDAELVQRAQAGDREAFGELTRRHRAKVYGYAKSIVNEPYIAEDIVQDALVRAFIHLGTLADMGRFLPWLHRIVRNQAYSELRSRPASREKSFSSLRTAGDAYDDQEDWSNLDRILIRLSASVERASEHNTTPEARLMRKELLHTIIGMLHCLNRKERRVFEAHFFHHLPPQEIAQLFQLSTANVYQILSRSRKKVMQEKIRVVVDHYVKNRKDMGCMNQKILQHKDELKNAPTWTSAGAVMYWMLVYTDKKQSFPMVMGLTGLAFRLHICEGDVHIAGPTMFKFSDILSKGMQNLGFRSRCIDGFRPGPGPNANHVDPFLLTPEAKEKRQLHEALPEALELIHQSINRGLPVLSWDLFIPEFGIIYGYDDEQQILRALECGRDAELPYSHLGRGILEDLFIMAIEDPMPIDSRRALSGALSMILNHYHGKEEKPSRGVMGLRAYDVWVEAFRGGAIEPNGNAYNIAVLHDARHYAAEFLKELGASWQGKGSADDRIRSLSLEASSIYADISDQLYELRVKFPFHAGGEPNEPNEPSHAERAITVLQSVKELEQRAVGLLENIHAELEVEG